VVRAFGREDREHARWESRARAGVNAEIRAVLVEAGFWLLIGVVVSTGAAAALWFGASHVLEGSLTLGALLMAMAYLSQAVEPLRTMGNRVSGLQRAFASADRVFAVLDTAPDVVDRPGARPLGRAAGRITLEGVRFLPPGAERPVLDEVSFDVPEGSRVAVVGPSGSGKTTLLTLIARFQDVSAGRVLLDGRDVREVRLADLRRQFAVVPQEPTLFATSVRENVAYGRPDASPAEIVEATQAAGAHDFVMELPQGYDTVLGERGQRLSGGQRQRIAIARAFLADAPVLLLDEPTSQLDVASEAAVLGALERLARARTTFVVAHRLSTVEGADLLLRVDGGTARLEAEAARTRQGGARPTPP
jgi:ATP-binding cassette subfamily B protein